MKQELFEGLPINKFCLKLVEGLCEGLISYEEFQERLSRALSATPDLFAGLRKAPWPEPRMTEVKEVTSAVACEEVEVP
jgi:hypothetical protein